MSSIFKFARKSVLYLLVVSLVLTILRQIFDVVGRLWMPILVNFVHMLFVIFGYFGAWQRRPAHIIASAFWIPFMLTWNVFLCCFYLSIDPLSRHSTLLSFGSRLSRSFFIERMPMCAYSYDYPSKEWHVANDCLLEYFYVEVGLSIAHFIVAFLAFDCMLVLLCTFPAQRSAEKRSPGDRRSVRSRRSMTRTVGGHTNHTFDTTYVKNPTEAGRRAQQDLRTDHMTVSAAPNGKSRRSRSHSKSRKPRNGSLYEMQSTARARSASPHRRSDAALETTHDDVTPFNVITDLPVLRNFAVTPPPYHAAQRRGSKSNLSVRSFQQYAEEVDPINYSRRLSVNEPRGIRSSNDSVLKASSRRVRMEKRDSRDQPISLVSFDPKSSTLIRYEQQGGTHIKDERTTTVETHTNRAYNDSPPSSWDSGHVTSESTFTGHHRQPQLPHPPPPQQLPPLMSYIRQSSRSGTPTQLDRPGTAYDSVHTPRRTPMRQAQPPTPTTAGASATTRLAAGGRVAPSYDAYNQSTARVPPYSRITISRDRDPPPMDGYSSLLV